MEVEDLAGLLEEEKDLISKEKELVTFHFDGLQILLADKKNVYIVANFGFYEDDKPCLVKMKRPMFNKALKEWIDMRAKYNTIGAYGAGFTEIIEYIKLRVETHVKYFWKLDDLSDNKKEDEDYMIEVPVIEVIEYYSEMEHG
jgi:hypothetical protein